MKHLDRYLRREQSRTLSLYCQGHLDVPAHETWTAKVVTRSGVPLARHYATTPSEALAGLNEKLKDEP